MFDIKFINDTVKRLSASVPPGLSQCKKELEANFRTVLQSVFARLDLVTREEFTVQKKVLIKTRAKMSLLAKQVEQLESLLTKKNKTMDS